MDFIETEVDYHAIDVGFSTVIVHDENGIEPDATFVRKDALDKVMDENDRLRELVETMHGDMREMLDTIDKSSDVWGYCRYFGECLDCAESIMRELGIEVDGWF